MILCKSSGIENRTSSRPGLWHAFDQSLWSRNEEGVTFSSDPNIVRGFGMSEISRLSSVTSYSISSKIRSWFSCEQGLEPSPFSSIRMNIRRRMLVLDADRSPAWLRRCPSSIASHPSRWFFPEALRRIIIPTRRSRGNNLTYSTGARKDSELLASIRHPSCLSVVLFIDYSLRERWYSTKNPQVDISFLLMAALGSRPSSKVGFLVQSRSRINWRWYLSDDRVFWGRVALHLVN